MDPLERVIRPIVEGQIRGFLKEHPSIISGVDWYNKRGADKGAVFVNSLAKRVILDLLCPLTRERIEAALFEIWESGVAPRSAPDGAFIGTFSDEQPVSAVARRICGEGDQIGTGPDLVAIALRASIMDGTYRPDHGEITRWSDYHQRYEAA